MDTGRKLCSHSSLNWSHRVSCKYSQGFSAHIWPSLPLSETVWFWGWGGCWCVSGCPLKLWSSSLDDLVSEDCRAEVIFTLSFLLENVLKQPYGWNFISVMHNSTVPAKLRNEVSPVRSALRRKLINTRHPVATGRTADRTHCLSDQKKSSSVDFWTSSFQTSWCCQNNK